MSRILVLSPHPDDEAIGCGGTLCGHAEGGDDVRVIFLTSGEAGGHGTDAVATRIIREGEARAAAAILGIRNIEFWRARDGALRASAALVRRLTEALRNWWPDVIYTTHGGEDHPDHRASARLAAAAFRAEHPRRPKIYQFEVWTPLASMDHVVDVSPWMQRKLSAVRAYHSQCSVLRFDDAVAGLNRYRGEMHSWPGGDYAEVFKEMLA